jgi:hypothetical protein
VPSESDIEQKDRDAAKRDGWFVEKIMRTGRDGFPDRFYAKGGRIILMEWKKPPSGKKPGGRLSAQQERRIAELRAAGVEVHVVDNLADARAIRGDF